MFSEIRNVLCSEEASKIHHTR